MVSSTFTYAYAQEENEKDFRTGYVSIVVRLRGGKKL
jgi:hypothetical protein